MALLIPAAAAQAMPDWAKKIIDSVGQATPDPGASAWILHRSVDVSVSGNGNTNTHIRLLVKVITQAGASDAVVVEGVYPQRQVKTLKGWIKRTDGTSDDLDLHHCLFIASRAAAGYYEDTRALVAELPRIEAGALVAFDYEIDEENWFNPYMGMYFQKQQPVRFAALRVQLAKGWRLDYELSNGPEISFSQDGNSSVWVGRNLGYRKPEPLMPDWDEVSPHIEVVCNRVEDSGESAAQGWSKIGGEVSRLMLEAAKHDSTIDRLAARLTDTVQDPTQMAIAIGRYVRDQVRYVAVEIGRGRIRPRPASQTLRNLYGDCKDKSALMRALLAAVGVPSFPVLARIGGEVHSQLPAGSQFNHCIVAIPAAALGLADTALAGARASTWFFFDPTAEHVQFGHIPSQLAGTFVLVCNDTVSQLLPLPRSGEPGTQRRFVVRAELSESGDLQAVVDLTESYPGYTQAALARRSDDPAAVESRWRKDVQAWLPGGVLSGLQSTAWDDSAHVHFELQARGYARRFGPEYVFQLVPVIDPHPPELGAPSRTYPIQLGESHLDEFDVRWTWPASLEPTSLPDAIADSCALGLVRGSVETDDLGLRVFVRRAYSEAWLGVDEYARAQRFDRNRAAVASMQMVLGARPNDR